MPNKKKSEDIAAEVASTLRFPSNDDESISEDDRLNMEAECKRMKRKAPNKNGEFNLNTTMLLKHTDKHFYRAKVIKIDRDTKNRPSYTIHYMGWNARYDETLSNEDAKLKFYDDDSNLNKEIAAKMLKDAKMREKKNKEKELAIKKAEKKKKSNQDSSVPQTPIAEAPEAAAETVVDEVFFFDDEPLSSAALKVKVLKVVLPEKLFDVLIQDKHSIAEQGKLHTLPASVTINTFFDDFLEAQSKKRVPFVNEALMKVRIQTLKSTINDALDKHLLYEPEYVQFILIHKRFQRKGKTFTREDHTRFYGGDNEDEVESSEASEDDADKPDDFNPVPHLCPSTPGDNAESSKKNKRKLKQQHKAGTGHKSPDYTGHYGLVHFLRFCYYAPTMAANEAAPTVVYNYMAETLIELLKYLNGVIDNLFSVEECYHQMTDEYKKQMQELASFGSKM